MIEKEGRPPAPAPEPEHGKPEPTFILTITQTGGITSFLTNAPSAQDALSMMMAANAAMVEAFKKKEKA